MRLIKAGATSQTIYVEILDSTSTSGARKTGLAFNTSGLTAYYVRNGGSATAITLATLAAANSAYSSGGFKEVDATNMPGIYRLDLPDAAVAAGVSDVVVTLRGATGMVQVSSNIQLTGADLQDSTFLGLSPYTFGITDSGTAQSVAGTTIQLKAGAPAYDISGSTVIVTSATTGAGQSRSILSYNTSTKTATVDTWGTTPTGTITYVVIGTPPASTSVPVPANVTQFGGTAITSAAGIPEVKVNNIAASAITATSIAANAITAAKVATDAIGAAQLAADAVTEIQSGLATASALSTAQTDLTTIKGKTNSLSFTVAGQVDANIQYVNDVLVNGNGAGIPWGP